MWFRPLAGQGLDHFRHSNGLELTRFRTRLMSCFCPLGGPLGFPHPKRLVARVQMAQSVRVNLCAISQ